MLTISLTGDGTFSIGARRIPQVCQRFESKSVALEGSAQRVVPLVTEDPRRMFDESFDDFVDVVCVVAD